MKLTVLGKYGPFPPAGGGTSSYRADIGATSLALDFGSGALGRWKQFGETLPDAVILSHLHFDHVADLFSAVYEIKTRLKVYMPFTDCQVKDLIFSVPEFEPIEISDGLEAVVGNVELKFAKMFHSLESYAVRISDGKRALFYSGDTSYGDKLLSAARGCNFMLLDAAQPSDAPIGVSHMRLADAARIASISGARVLATHIHPLFPPYDEADALNVKVAEEMSSYEI